MTVRQNLLWLLITVNFCISAYGLGHGHCPWWYSIPDVLYAGVIVWFFLEAAEW